MGLRLGRVPRSQRCKRVWPRLEPSSLWRQSLMSANPLCYSICLSNKHYPALGAFAFTKKHLKDALSKLETEQWASTSLGALRLLWQVAEIQAVRPVPRLLFLDVRLSTFTGWPFHWGVFQALNPIHLALSPSSVNIMANIWRQMRSVTPHPDAVMLIHVAAY